MSLPKTIYYTGQSLLINASLKQPSDNALRTGLPPRLLLYLDFDSIRVSHQVHLRQFDSLCLLDELPSQVHDEHDGQLDVEADKADAVELRAEAGPALDEYQEAVEDDAEPGAVGVSPVLER